MPLWGRRRPPSPPPGGPAATSRPPGQDEADQAALGRGGLPAAVEERLGRVRQHELPWTSTLSVADWTLSRGQGFSPIGQVMGSSIYHTGWSFPGVWQSGELSAPTQAAHAVRNLALERMRQEAALLGADGVIAVRLVRRAYDWGPNLIEFTAMGTAVRVPDAAASGGGRPFLATVDGSDFAKLLAAGYVPLGVALGVSVVYLYTNWSAQMQEMSWANQEMVQFTEATYGVRSLAMQRLKQQASADGADGVIAFGTDMRVEKVEQSNGQGQDRTDHIIEFSALGTEVGRMRRAEPQTTPIRTVSLQDPTQGA